MARAVRKGESRRNLGGGDRYLPERDRRVESCQHGIDVGLAQAAYQKMLGLHRARLLLGGERSERLRRRGAYIHFLKSLLRDLQYRQGSVLSPAQRASVERALSREVVDRIKSANYVETPEILRPENLPKRPPVRRAEFDDE